MFFREMSGDPKFNPFHLVKIMPKLDNATDRDQNLIVSAGGQDASACKISGHYIRAISGKYLETHISPISKLRQNLENQQPSTII